MIFFYNNVRTIILLTILFVLKCNTALDYNKNQRQNTNTDFLLHEGGVPVGGNKRDYVAPNSQTNTQNTQNSGKRDYVAEFPALGPPTASPTRPSTTTTHNINSGPQHNGQSSNGKRDYVASQFPTLKPVQHNQPNDGSKRDYVAPQFPTLKPVQQNNQPGNKRDYVASQNPTTKPVQSTNQPTGGKVKDLINFYDSHNTNPSVPSYSNILQGNNNKNGVNSLPSSSTTKLSQPVTPSSLSTSSVSPTKPMSFSSIVSGSNKPGTASTLTTPKPTTRLPASPNTPASRPGSPVLPSSIVNNNRGTVTGNSVTNEELQTLSEELLRKDVNNAAKYITVNYQDRTTSYSKDDKAPSPLLTVSSEAWNIPTIQKFVPLLDNYEKDTLVNEYVTPQERNEENAFMDAVMATTVMRHLMTFLKNKGYVTPDPKQQRDFVKQLWFTLYSRGKGKISSSGFEHVFVSEYKISESKVLGFHNWIHFAKEEVANRANYLGYMKYLQLNDKGVIVKIHTTSGNLDKPVNTMYIGASPELEMALYTLCYVTRVEKDCKVKLANQDVNIDTYNFRYRSKNLIGSAFFTI